MNFPHVYFIWFFIRVFFVFFFGHRVHFSSFQFQFISVQLHLFAPFFPPFSRPVCVDLWCEKERRNEWESARVRGAVGDGRKETSFYSSFFSSRKETWYYSIHINILLYKYRVSFLNIEYLLLLFFSRRWKKWDSGGWKKTHLILLFFIGRFKKIAHARSSCKRARARAHTHTCVRARGREGDGKRERARVCWLMGEWGGEWLQDTRVRCSVLQSFAVCCGVLQCVAVYCSVLQRRGWWVLMLYACVTHPIHMWHDSFEIDMFRSYRSWFCQVWRDSSCLRGTHAGQDWFVCDMMSLTNDVCHMWWHTKCCSALQCIAVCCSALQCIAVCCSALQCIAVCCSVMWHTSFVTACHKRTTYVICDSMSLTNNLWQEHEWIMSLRGHPTCVTRPILWYTNMTWVVRKWHGSFAWDVRHVMSHMN